MIEETDQKKKKRKKTTYDGVHQGKQNNIEWIQIVQMWKEKKIENKNMTCGTLYYYEKKTQNLAQCIGWNHQNNEAKEMMNKKIKSSGKH